MKIAVKVLPREEVLDSQGRAVEKTLEHNNMAVDHCRIGKYIVLDFSEDDVTKAKEKATEIANSLLHNPLIEQFELEVL
ncbi:MAG: phosphoribosylformylglycinamidine synthase subunit PurS [Bdellovibrionales bacterium]|nr:phosphoribosylformylglycinamidine synthase subunit PurS [Bdellovibrionales bacterium]MCB0412824.1 phosphoribosylformylglycinamidine synthase subunit PurS [Bdellovibrionales bacterium]